MIVSAEFAALLRAGRRDFNARVEEARRCYPTFSTEQFRHFLTRCVDPLVRTVAADRCGFFASGVFDVALELVGRELCGAHARGAQIEALWLDVLPSLSQYLASQPADRISLLCNALLNLFAQGARVDQWLQLMRKHGPGNDNLLLEVGLLAAWRSGAAQYRLAALSVMAKHPHLAQQFLELPERTDLYEVLLKLEQEPWFLTPHNASDPVREIGAFAGFGGKFSGPPEVRASKEGFVINSAERFFFLIVDAFGEALLPTNASAFQAAEGYRAPTNQSPTLKGSRLTGPRGEFELNLCPDHLQFVWNEHSAAAFSPFSFSIWVVPWR